MFSLGAFVWGAFGVAVMRCSDLKRAINHVWPAVLGCLWSVHAGLQGGGSGVAIGATISGASLRRPVRCGQFAAGRLPYGGCAVARSFRVRCRSFGASSKYGPVGAGGGGLD